MVTRGATKPWERFATPNTPARMLLVVSSVLEIGLSSLAPMGLPAALAADTTVVPRGDSVREDSTARDSLAAADSAAADTSSITRAAETLAAHAVAATPETTTAVPTASVPVFLGGKEIFRVRSGRDGLTTEERAAAIRQRLTVAVRDRDAPADSVRLFTTPDGVEIRLRKHFLWVITAADVEGVNVADLAIEMAELPSRIAEGVKKERAGRRPLGILISFLIALGVTLVAWVLARLLWATSRRWRAFLDRNLPRYVKGIRFRNFEVLSQAQLTAVLGGVLARLDVVVGLLLLYSYLTIVLSLFPWTQGWSWLLVTFARERVVEAAISIGEAIPGVIVIAVIVMLFRWLVQLSDRFFEAIAAGAVQIGSFHPELARPSKRLLRILLWIIAVMIAYPYIPGAQSKAVQGVSLLLGLMVSLGSTGFVGNVISGVVLTYSRSFSVGDRVRIGDHVGDIVSLGFFATKLRSIRNEEVTLPNGQVASQPIVNYTRLAADPGLILHTEVTIGYDVDWRTVHALLVEAAGNVEGIEKEPAPWVFQRSLNDPHVTYELNCVTHQSHPQLRLYSGLHEQIQDAFARAGIEILSPGYHAIRDANLAVLPDEPKGPRPAPGGFRVKTGEG